MTALNAEPPRPASAPRIWGEIPVRNMNFTGRVDILERLRAGTSSRVTAVLPDPDNPLPQAVQGLGGVGKTSIAVEYAYRFSGDYDIVWWIPADQLPTVRGSLAALAEKLRLDPPPGSGIDGAISAVLDALRRGDPYHRWLLIFDNANDPEEILQLIPPGPGDVLITSRNRRWQAVIDTVPMDVFLRHESTEFLLKRVPKDLSEVDADRLAEKLGDLPLALEQAAALLSESGMSAEDYLTELDENVSALMGEGKSPDYPLSMTAAWQLSVSKLKQRSEDALELLRCCAFFGPEPIPRNVFRRGAQPTGTAVADVISSPIAMSRAVRELNRYALVTLGKNSISVHRLIQALLRDGLTPEERESYRREVHIILANAAPEDPDDSDNWARFRGLQPHVNAVATELQMSREPATRDLARKTMRFLDQSGDYRSALQFSRRFIDQWTADSGADDPDVLAALRHQANIQRNLGLLQEAFATTEATLSRCRRVLGEDDPTTLSLRSSFGADLRSSGKFRAAREFDEESLPLLEAKYGAGDSRHLRLMSSLALDYGLASDYARARDLYDEAYRRMSPGRSNATATDLLGAWIGLAWALRLLGQYNEAYDLLLDAQDYAQDTSVLGTEHLATLRTVNAYTIVCRRLADKRLEALELVRSTHDLATRLHGEAHPDSLAIAVSMSNLLRTVSNEYHPDALKLAEVTARHYPGVYGADHPFTYGCLGNVALLKRMTNDAAGARILDEEALAGLTASLGPDHHFTLTVATNLASDLAVLGDKEQARSLGEETYRRLSALLGPTHMHTLGCGANLALDRIATGDVSGGQELQTYVLDSYLATQGETFPEYVVAAAGGRIDPDFDPPPL